MSNRVSPAPHSASSSLTAVDSPIPDDLLPPLPPPPPLSDDDYDEAAATGAKARYVPQTGPSVTPTPDIQQAVYTPPPPPPDEIQNQTRNIGGKNENDTATADTDTTAASPKSETTTTAVERFNINSSEHDDNRNYNDNDVDEINDDDFDDTVYPKSTRNLFPVAVMENGGGGDGEETKAKVEVEEGAESAAGNHGSESDDGVLRLRNPANIGRLPPLANSTNVTDDGERRGAPAERPGVGNVVTTSWDHYPTPRQQQQQQQQHQPQQQQEEGDYSRFNQSHNYHQQQQQQSSYQEFAMSARPNSRKDREDDTVIGANSSASESGCCAIILTIFSYILVVIFLPFSLCVTIKVVQEYERAVIFRLGRLLPGGAKGPGIFFVMPCIEEYTKVDLRTVSFDVPPQEVLTRDSVTVSVDAVVYYRISNPTVSVANVENAANSTQLLAQTTLRNVLGTQNLAEILSNREHISEQMQIVLDGATDKWGIKVERVEIKDVRLPTQLQRAMATEAEAARDARAKVIAAEGEQKASVALKEAASIIADTPAAMQLRYLQTLNSISAEKNSTIIFPIPIELVGSLMKK